MNIFENIFKSIVTMANSWVKVVLTLIGLSIGFILLFNILSSASLVTSYTAYAFNDEISIENLQKVKNWYLENNRTVEIIKNHENDLVIDNNYWLELTAFHPDMVDAFFSVKTNDYFIVIEKNSNIKSVFGFVDAPLMYELGIKGFSGYLSYVNRSGFINSILIFMLPISLFLIAFFSRRNLNDHKSPNYKNSHLFLIIINGCLYATFIFWVLSLVKVENSSYNFDFLFNNFKFITLFYLILLAPIAEEMFFRWFLLEMFIQRKLKYFGLILTAGSFAGIHGMSGDNMFDVVRMLVLFSGGLILGMIYLKYRKLLYPVLFHIMYNLITIVLTKFIGT